MEQISFLLAALLISSSAAAASLKIGLLQIEDSAPFYVAEQEGFFKDENVRVEPVPLPSALTAGAISDPIGALPLYERLLNQHIFLFSGYFKPLLEIHHQAEI